MKTMIAVLATGLGVSGCCTLGSCTEATMETTRYSGRAAIVPQPCQVSIMQTAPVAEKLAAADNSKRPVLSAQEPSFELAPLK